MSNTSSVKGGGRNNPIKETSNKNDNKVKKGTSQNRRSTVERSRVSNTSFSDRKLDVKSILSAVVGVLGVAVMSGLGLAAMSVNPVLGIAAFAGTIPFWGLLLYGIRNPGLYYTPASAD